MGAHVGGAFWAVHSFTRPPNGQVSGRNALTAQHAQGHADARPHFPSAGGPLAPRRRAPARHRSHSGTAAGGCARRAGDARCLVAPRKPPCACCVFTAPAAVGARATSPLSAAATSLPRRLSPGLRLPGGDCPLPACAAALLYPLCDIVCCGSCGRRPCCALSRPHDALARAHSDAPPAAPRCVPPPLSPLPSPYMCAPLLSAMGWTTLFAVFLL